MIQESHDFGLDEWVHFIPQVLARGSIFSTHLSLLNRPNKSPELVCSHFLLEGRLKYNSLFIGGSIGLISQNIIATESLNSQKIVSSSLWNLGVYSQISFSENLIFRNMLRYGWPQENSLFGKLSYINGFNFETQFIFKLTPLTSFVSSYYGLWIWSSFFGYEASENMGVFSIGIHQSL